MTKLLGDHHGGDEVVLTCTGNIERSRLQIFLGLLVHDLVIATHGLWSQECVGFHRERRNR